MQEPSSDILLELTALGKKILVCLLEKISSLYIIVDKTGSVLMGNTASGYMRVRPIFCADYLLNIL